MKGYKGFNKGLICRGKRYAEDTVFEEESAVLCETGMHFCKLPHQVFQYYAPSSGSEFAEVEALDEVQTDDGKKFVATKLKIGKKISVAELCKRSVPEFFKAFEFDKKIEEAQQTKESCSGYRGAANAGKHGTATAGDCGTANAGDFGAASAGNYGAANADYRGAANAGDCGAANAGEFGVANAGRQGAANARYCGVANVGDYGVANAEDRGAANAGDFGAANVGHHGTANAGLYGVASAGCFGAANVGFNGLS